MLSGTVAAQQGTPVMVAPAPPERPARQLLPGAGATGAATDMPVDQLPQTVREYDVRQAAARPYGPLRVEIYQAVTESGAFGLFAYFKAAGGADLGIGAASAPTADGLTFWKGHYAVRLADARAAGQVTPAHTRLAKAVAAAIPQPAPPARPALLAALPPDGLVAGSERYFAGPEALNAFVERGRDMFGFAGDAEAVLAEYGQGDGRPPLKLVIVEYHTPQFATEAHERVRGYLDSLPEEQRHRHVLQRVGNYLAQAINADDREAAARLVKAVKYEYEVRWLDEPPRRGISEAEHYRQVAQVLLSSFGIIGVTMAVALVVGGTWGALIFARRRREMRQTFSNAGGMLRLELDPMEAVILGLPPKRDNN